MRQTVLTAKQNGSALVKRKHLECAGQILFEGEIHDVWIMCSFQLLLIDADELFSPARFLAKNVVADAIKPGRKLRFAAKAPDVFVGAQKRFLRQIIGEREIGSRKLAKQTAHARLMISHQLREGMMIIIEDDSGDEVCISERHVRGLEERRWRRAILPHVQFPDQEVAEANHQRDDTDAPFTAAKSAIHRREEDN